MHQERMPYEFCSECHFKRTVLTVWTSQWNELTTGWMTYLSVHINCTKIWKLLFPLIYRIWGFHGGKGLQWTLLGYKPMWSSKLASVWELIISNPSQNTFYPVLYGFPQSLMVNSGIVPHLRHNCFLPHPFQFIIYQSLYNLLLYSLRLLCNN
jgi:hypothetical protein